MITANVKGVGTQMIPPVQGGVKAGLSANAADSFQNVLSRQTDSPKRPQEAQGGKKADQKTKPQDAKDAGALGKKTQDLQAQDAAAEQESLSEETVDAAKEAAMQVLIQVADAFGMTPEEVQGLMQEMGMEELDLLSADRLGNLVLEASGAEGSFELVTDGELYQKFQDILASQKELTQELSKDAGIDAQTLMQKLEQLSKAPQETDLSKEMDRTQTGREEKPLTIEVTREELTALKETQTAQDGQRASNETGSDPEKKDRGQEKAAGEQSGNLVLAQMLEEAKNPQAAAVQQDVRVADADTQNIMRQIMDYMRVQIRPEVSSLEMQLHPAGLGSVQIQLASRGGAVTAQFIAQNETVKAVLETQMIQLKENFEEQGIRVETIEVSVQTRSFDQNLQGQEQGGAQQQAASSRGRRRIQLSGTSSQEDLDAMTPDEKLTAEVMAANGQTVDYMA